MALDLERAGRKTRKGSRGGGKKRKEKGRTEERSQFSFDLLTRFDSLQTEK